MVQTRDWEVRSGYAVSIGLQDDRQWRGPWAICRPTSCPMQVQLWCQMRMIRAFFSQILNLRDWKLHHLLETYSLYSENSSLLVSRMNLSYYLFPTFYTHFSKGCVLVSLTPLLQALRLPLNSQSHLLHRLSQPQSCSLPLQGRVSSLDHILVFPGLSWAGDPKQNALLQFSLCRAELCICPFLWLLLAYFLSLGGSSGHPSLVTPADLTTENSDSFFGH